MQIMLEASASTRDAIDVDEGYADWTWCATVPTTWKLEVPLVADEEDCNG